MKPSDTSLVQRIPWTLVVFILALTIPWLGSRYDTFLATQISISALFAVSLNLLLGIQSRGGMFLELRGTAYSQPHIRFVVGYNF